MMLGKRARPPMKRTTSMTEFTLGFNAEYQQQQFLNPFNGGGGGGLDHQLLGSTAAPQRRNSGDFSETANFLRVCSLCKRRLVPGRDIYMYRGDTAFCSLECRQQQMTQDERKEKCSLASKTKETAAAATTTTTAAGGAQVSATG